MQQPSESCNVTMVISTLLLGNPLAWIPIKGKPANIQGRILGEKPGVFAFFCWIWLCSRES